MVQFYFPDVDDEDFIEEQEVADQYHEIENLTFCDYQEEALAFRLPNADHVYALLNLAGEVGELLSKVAKHIRDHTDTEDEDYLMAYREAVGHEIGDVLWMCAAIADDFDLDLAEIAYFNIKKLEDRKQRGKLKGSGDTR